MAEFVRVVDVGVKEAQGGREDDVFVVGFYGFFQTRVKPTFWFNEP